MLTAIRARSSIVVLLLVACHAHGVPPVQPAPPASKPPGSPPAFLYLHGCDPYWERVDLTTLRATGAWDLHARAPQQVLPVERTDGCAIHSPVFEPRSGRMFLAAPRTPSEDAEGRRFDSIVGLLLPSFQVTDAFGGDWTLQDPLALLVDDQGHLLASDSRSELPFGVGNGSITWIDVSRPGKAQRMVRRDGVSFTRAAVFEDGTIWDEMRAIRFENGQPRQTKLDLSALLADPKRGAALLPYSTPNSPSTHKPFVTDDFLAAHGNRALFNLRGEATMTLVVGTIAPPAARLMKTTVPLASTYLIVGGKRILMIERRAGEDTGRLVTLDADSGAVRKDWRVGELQIPGVHYLCAKDDLVFFGAGKRLLVVPEGSSKVTSVAVQRELDSYARCLFADR